jgi:hypothetical protein
MTGDAVLIKAADVLHNVLTLALDLDAARDAQAVMDRFNAGPEKQLWYFESVAEAVEGRLGDHALSRELNTAVARLRATLYP